MALVCPDGILERRGGVQRNLDLSVTLENFYSVFMNESHSAMIGTYTNSTTVVVLVLGDREFVPAASHIYFLSVVETSFVAEEDLSYFYFADSGGGNIYEVSQSFDITQIYDLGGGYRTGTRIILTDAFYFSRQVSSTQGI